MVEIVVKIRLNRQVETRLQKALNGILRVRHDPIQRATIRLLRRKKINYLCALRR